MTTSTKVQQSDNIEPSEEQKFFERRPIWIFQEDGIMGYSHGFCHQLFTRTELEYLKNRIEETLEYYDQVNSTDKLVNDINRITHETEMEEQMRSMYPEKKKKQPREGYIYLIQNTVNKHLKIGFSKNPNTRLQQLNTASPEPLEMICYMKGTLDKEKAIHEGLSHLRLNTEWYPESQEVYKHF